MLPLLPQCLPPPPLWTPSAPWLEHGMHFALCVWPLAKQSVCYFVKFRDELRSEFLHSHWVSVSSSPHTFPKETKEQKPRVSLEPPNCPPSLVSLFDADMPLLHVSREECNTHAVCSVKPNKDCLLLGVHPQGKRLGKF